METTTPQDVHILVSGHRIRLDSVKSGFDFRSESTTEGKTMDMLTALKRCKEGMAVRPVCWNTTNPGHWVRYIPSAKGFVEHGEMEEMPHALRFFREEEFLGNWEEVPEARW